MRAPKAALLLACALMLPPGPARAQDNGGGAYPSAPALVEKIACRSGCAPGGQAGFGSVVRVAGRDMDGVRWVVFLGGPGPHDDVVATVLRGTPRWVDVRVPEGAPAGRLRLRKGDGTPSSPSVPLVALTGAPAPAEEAPPQRVVADRDTTDAVDAAVDTRRVFYAGPRDATLRYVVTAPEPVELVVELIRARGRTVARWTPGAPPPGAEQVVHWDGTVAGRAAPPGRYAFHVIPVGARAARGGAAPEVVDSFRFLDHKFPVRGRHDFGGAGAVFGTGRAGHSHQGQDVFAACGTPLVAARGGTVVFKAFQERAGNYVVVRGDGNGVDYVYMHLTDPAVVERGEHVRTGSQLGTVGDTGNAVGCHLHFELWSAPGWYEGGVPFDPLPDLRAWDAMT